MTILPIVLEELRGTLLGSIEYMRTDTHAHYFKWVFEGDEEDIKVVHKDNSVWFKSDDTDYYYDHTLSV